MPLIKNIKPHSGSRLGKSESPVLISARPNNCQYSNNHSTTFHSPIHPVYHFSNNLHRQSHCNAYKCRSHLPYRSTIVHHRCLRLHGTICRSHWLYLDSNNLHSGCRLATAGDRSPICDLHRSKRLIRNYFPPQKLFIANWPKKLPS